MYDETVSGRLFNFNLRFPGQYFDIETGKHYNYFRDYDPSIGRYIQSDPIGLSAGTNTFAYVSAAPLGFADAFGLQIAPPGGATGGAIGGFGGLGGWGRGGNGAGSNWDGWGGSTNSWGGNSNFVPVPGEGSGSSVPLPCTLKASYRLTTTADPPYPGSNKPTVWFICEYECTESCGRTFRFIRTMGLTEGGCPTTQWPRSGDRRVN